MKKKLTPQAPFEIAKRYVEVVCNQPKDSHYKDHLLRTVYWMKKLRHSVNEAVLVAGILHDIERVFKNYEYTIHNINSREFMNRCYLIWHQKRSANIACAMLREKNIDINFVRRVYVLILHHEEGGDEEQNLLKDADSLSFFETGVDHFLDVWVPIVGKEKVREKFDWMFERITSQVAKKTCETLYISAIKRLRSLNKYSI